MSAPASAPAPKRPRTEFSSSSSTSSLALKTGSKLYCLIKEQERHSPGGSDRSIRVLSIFSDQHAANLALLKSSFVQDSIGDCEDFGVGLDRDGNARAIYHPDQNHMTRLFVGEAIYKSGTKTQADVQAELSSIQEEGTADLDFVGGRYEHDR